MTLSLLKRRPLPRGGGRPPRQPWPDLTCGPLQSGRARSPLQSGLLQLARLPLETRLWRLPRLPLQARLPRRIVGPRRIGPPQGALLGDDLAAERLRGVDLAHKTLIA
jgi:hypothetical protein